MPKNVLLYARHAVDDRTAASLETQLYYGKQFIEKKAWRHAKTYTDTDIGEVVFMAQPGVQKLFALLECEEIGVILCHTLDRLCSRLRVASRLLDVLRPKGIELWEADTGMRITGTNLHTFFLEDRRNFLDTIPVDLRETERLLHSPFGYRYSVARDAYGQQIVGFKVIDQAAANIVRRIFEMYANGTSPAKIADSLNAENVVGPNDRRWRDATIRGDGHRQTGILNDPIYVGGNAPALRIVSDELWERVTERQRAIAVKSVFAMPHRQQQN
ncbi:recombinase family protein [Rhizobium mayense]|uniref:Recombinase family protein n=1 Tax=Rhizobium mayense TaxID=1312184 RepID=A0ABT7JVG0_9HYPH|nr:recombinase family protein [Rhizobium mayense]MDL2400327.1 recombinase family protein [Rhizobium mayense]